MRKPDAAMALLREWAESEQVVRVGAFGDEQCRCCEAMGSRVRRVVHYDSCRWIRTRTLCGLPPLDNRDSRE